jgi:type I restriction enzyme S subunit
MKSDSMRKAMIGRGANIQNLSQAILSKLSIPIPPLSLQQEFVDFARQVNKSRFVAQQQIEKLQMLYDSLAQEYFGD